MEITLKPGQTMLLLLLVVFGYGQHKMDQGHENGNMDKQHMKEMVTFENAHVNESYQHYEDIRNALVASNPKKAKGAAEALYKLSKDGKPGEAVSIAAFSIAETTDIERQRRAFSTLSEAMIDLVRNKVTTGKLFRAFCPMALNGGGYWLSSVQTISNPYFGEKMLGCGSIKETIQ